MLILLFAWLSTLPISSGIVNCRIACRHCREKLEHPEMLEVYCAMCDECKERRREWLEGAPGLLRTDNTEDYLTNYGHHQDSQDECPTTPIDETCDEDPPVLLAQTIPTTTTPAATTTTTTRRPCPSKPCTKPTIPPCQSLACPIPMAIPVCPMCPMQMGGSVYTVTPVPSNRQESTTKVAVRLLTGKPSDTSELYLYLGVPKKLLKQLELSRS